MKKEDKVRILIKNELLMQEKETELNCQEKHKIWVLIIKEIKNKQRWKK